MQLIATFVDGEFPHSRPCIMLDGRHYVLPGSFPTAREAQDVASRALEKINTRVRAMLTLEKAMLVRTKRARGSRG